MNANCTPTYARRYVARPQQQSAPVSRTYGPATDIVENDNNVTLIIDLPGIAPADISIKMVDGLLTVKARRERSKDGENKPRFVRHERIFGDFERSFRLPRTVDATGIKANFKNGSLHITAPKTDQAKPRTIEIAGE